MPEPTARQTAKNPLRCLDCLSPLLECAQRHGIEIGPHPDGWEITECRPYGGRIEGQAKPLAVVYAERDAKLFAEALRFARCRGPEDCPHECGDEVMPHRRRLGLTS